MFQHALLNELLAFVAVADYSSFTRAAEHLQTTKSNVGKAVQKIESDLGVKLFQRSTRTVRLTEEGLIYLEAARQAVDTIKEARTLLDARQVEPAGRLRVNMPIGIGRTLMAELDRFIRSYPKVTVELSLSDRFEEAIGGDWDIVVRIGELSDSNMVARKLCQLRSVLCASPAYFARSGRPQNLNELHGHSAIVFRSPDGRLRPWQLREKAGEMIDISPPPTAVVSDGRTLVDATLNGLGIAQVYDKALGRALVNGDLIEILPEAAPQGPPVHALITAGRSMPSKTRVFVDFLVSVFA